MPTTIRERLGGDIIQVAAADRALEPMRLGDAETFAPESVLVECVHVLERFYRVPRRAVSGKIAGLL